MSGVETLRAIIAANRAGAPRGIASWCTAHPDTLRAVLRAHLDVTGPILIEATCNQVNQDGGYTGMNPAQFRSFAEGLARDEGIGPQRLILGGDHLGPNPWRHLPAAEAMEAARQMVKAYAQAGFEKIHLDASMACADDGLLGEEIMAERAAELCAAAEAAAALPPAYVIGTEVPVPGGETDALHAISVTRPEAVKRTYELHADAFRSRGLGDALSRVIALVVQPGVDFDNANVTLFNAANARALTGAAEELPGALFEAHSTDYQTEPCLADLVAGHFAILKVGPELTFAYREAIFAMAAIEERIPLTARSNVIGVIDDVMNRDDRDWRPYVPVGENQRAAKLSGLSDRVRYYWPNAEIAQAVRQLQENIDRKPAPRGLVLQYAGEACLDRPELPLSRRIIDSRLGAVARKYLSACGALSTGTQASA
jgi:D-tagatose-bisphosphate aldolase class II non-catalytic subunit